MLFNGERVGDGIRAGGGRRRRSRSTARRLRAKGMPNAIAVLAVAERGAMYDPSAVFYMEKLVVGPDGADVIDITAPIGVNLARHREGQGRAGRRPHRVHPRPAPARGARRRGPRRGCAHQVHLATATSPARSWLRATAPASTCSPASAARPRASSPPARSAAIGGMIQGRLWPRDEAERRKALDAGHDLDRVLTTSDLVTPKPQNPIIRN